MIAWYWAHQDLLTRLWGLTVMALVAFGFWGADREEREYYDWLEKKVKKP